MSTVLNQVGHYPYNLGPSKSNERIQVPGPELTLNLVARPPPPFGWAATQRAATSQASLGLLLGF